MEKIKTIMEKIKTIMEKIKTLFANLNKKDAAIVISAAILSLGILGAVIAFGVIQWRWLIGIGVPVAADGLLIWLIVSKLKKAAAAAAAAAENEK